MTMFAPETKKAVAYYRHSAEDKQENSVHIQRGHAKEFAQKYNLTIIHEEADEGKSGLVADRPGFDRLFNNWILSPEAPQFDYILVYDVSRWGRFQDPDEAAHYAMIAKKRGKTVIYITHGFPSEENTLLRNLQTPIERYMAAEYSRQLSDKVWHGSMKVSEQGFSAGGTAPYGMNRILLDENKQPIRPLKKGEHKVIANQRVTFAPAEDETNEVIKRIFTMLVHQWYRPEEIAERLNSEGIPSANGGKWNKDKIVKILTNETYIGSRVYNKTWGRLKQKKRANPRDEWIICQDAFGAIVDNKTFRKAQENLYWLMPSKWKRGAYTIRKVDRVLRAKIDELISQNGEYSDDAKWHAIRYFPLICGVTFFDKNVSRWCFMISEEQKQYDYVIALGVDIYSKDPIDTFFVIPTADFGIGNYLSFSQDEEQHSLYKTEAEDVEKKVIELCHAVASKY